MVFTALMHWSLLLLSVLLVTAYEFHFRKSSRHSPQNFARTTHARIRTRWVHELMQKPGSELLAIQTIRNSVMSSTITASTAVLALMGVFSLLSTRMSPGVVVVLSPHALLAAMLVAVLFATFVLSAMAVRFFNHAGYLMGSQAQGEARAAISELAARYMVRAGNYYSQAMRTLLWLPPVAAGMFSPWLMFAAAIVLLYVLAWFDRTPESLDERLAMLNEVQP